MAVLLAQELVRMREANRVCVAKIGMSEMGAGTAVKASHPHVEEQTFSVIAADKELRNACLWSSLNK